MESSPTSAADPLGFAAVIRKCLALLALAALAACAPRGLPPIVSLPPGGTWRGEIDLTGAARLDFSLDVPADAAVVFVSLSGELSDLELYGNPSLPIDDVREAAYASLDPGEAHTLELARFGPDPVAGATWHFTAWWPFADVPRRGGRRVDRAEVELTVEVHAARTDAVLVPGVAARAALEPESGGFRSFRVDVPEGADVLRLDLFDVSSNLDLYARHGAPALALGPEVAFAESAWGHETLVIDAHSSPALRAGPWYVEVADAFGPTRRLPFQLLASLDAEVPEILRRLPVIPPVRDTGPLARALLAVVEITTEEGSGSGTILTPDGWILTSAHVIGEREDVEIVVSLSIDPTLPAEECFHARVGPVDRERDLALLHVESGLYGQPLPPDYRLPTLALGSADALAIGDPPWLVGYPATGGTGSRVTISATRGILSGFERADSGTLLKTDAEITQGNSGGAALDEHGRLVGVPSSTVENGSGQIGYLRPVEMLPAAWLRALGR